MTWRGRTPASSWWLRGTVSFEPPPDPEPAPRPSEASAPPATTPPEERELLTLKQLVAYSALSERTLRDYINAPLRALPCYRIGVKVLVRKSEFDAWMLQHRQVGPAGLDRVVDSVIGPSKRRR